MLRLSALAGWNNETHPVRKARIRKQDHLLVQRDTGVHLGPLRSALAYGHSSRVGRDKCIFHPQSA